MPRDRTSFVAELAGGWRELTSRTWLWVSILAFCGWNAALAVFFVLGPVVVSEELGGARDWGIVMSGAAAGGLLGGALALRWKPARPLVALFGIVNASALPLLLLVPPAPVLAMTGAAVLATVGVSFSIAVWTTTLQEHVPEHALARVSAYDWLGSLVVMPLAYAAAGPVAAVAGVDATLVGAAALMLTAGLAPLALPSVRNLRSGEGAPYAPAVPDPAK